MADYWKSQPRKFCQYCKCWIADNKPSIEFHERGKNHKQNVAAKIEEIKKKSIDKAKKEEKMSKEFAAMEEAAMKAYQEDMKRLQAESGASGVPSRVGASGVPSRVGASGVPSRVGASGVPSRVGASGVPSRVGASKFSSKRKTQKSEVKVTTVTYTSSKSDAWLQGTTDDGVTYYYNTLTGESQWEKPEGFQGESVSPSTQQTEQATSGSAWMEAVSPDGYTYYYNTETGESSWEKPADYSPAEESPGKESPAEGSPEQETAEQQVSSTPQPESLSGEDDSSEVQTDTTGDSEEKESRVPKISFRKRTEKTQGEEKSDEKSDEGTEEEKDNQTVESSQPAEDKETPAKKARKATPYGEWAQIQDEEDPYDNIDLQLPQTEGGATSSTTSDLPPVPKAKFKERTITTLGDEYSSETTFKKRKTENGKSRRLRQRGKDD